MIEAGEYSLQVVYGLVNSVNAGDRIEQTDWIGPIRITWDYESTKAPFLGMFGVPIKAQFIDFRNKTI
jgi:lipopolysaccharide transport system ATP-binding protein